MTLPGSCFRGFSLFRVGYLSNDFTRVRFSHFLGFFHCPGLIVSQITLPGLLFRGFEGFLTV